MKKRKVGLHSHGRQRPSRGDRRYHSNCKGTNRPGSQRPGEERCWLVHEPCSRNEWRHHRAPTLVGHVMAAFPFSGSHCRSGRTHAIAGVIAHTRAIMRSANARVLVTLSRVSFLNFVNKLLPTTMLESLMEGAVTAITVPRVVTGT